MLPGTAIRCGVEKLTVLVSFGTQALVKVLSKQW